MAANTRKQFFNLGAGLFRFLFGQPQTQACTFFLNIVHNDSIQPKGTYYVCTPLGQSRGWQYSGYFEIRVTGRGKCPIKSH